MFGYVRAYKPEMRIKEFEMYKTVYCSLCKELGKSYGPFARLTLSYDFAFLGVLNMSLSEDRCPTNRKMCTCNPLKKCTYLENRDPLRMPAAAAMIMLYYKLLDNIADEKGIKRLGYLLLKGIYSAAHKKAAAQYPEIEEFFAEYIAAQRILENENCQSPDRASDPTAKVLARVFELCSKDETQKRILSRMGYCMGRYIYLLDAAVDLPDDIKKGNYNPLKASAEDSEYIKNTIVPQLNIAAAEAAMAFELLDIKKLKNILGNIICIGMEETYKKELNL